jgi:signal transduction histidine kinase
MDQTATRARIDHNARSGDLAVAAAALIWTVLTIGIEPGADGHTLPIALLFAVLGAAPLLLRRHTPWLCLVLCVAASVAVPAVTLYAPATLVAVYSVASFRGREEGIVAGVVAFGSFLGHRLLFGGGLAATEWASIVSLTGFAIVAGLYGAARRSYLDGMDERSELLAEQSVAEERLRIARELHDAVGHKVSLMVISAQALEASSTGVSGAAAASIAALGREAMGEMRATVSLMRPVGEGAEREPGPSLAELARLVDQTREAGIGTELRLEGERRRYPVAVELSAYRIVQEALTNVARHADARNATVRVRFAESELGIEVVDDGHGPRGEAVPGNGLIGMRERAALFGGELEFGPVEPAGFRVAARIPATMER